MAKLYVGLSGYSYKEWQGEGLFYPPGLSQSKYFRYYSAHFNAIESFAMVQRLPSEASIQKMIDESPDGFKVCPKMHQEVTHFKRLKPECADMLNAFVKAVEPLEKAGKLGLILLQLPESFKRDDERLETFLKMLPERTSLRWSFEFRDASWHAPEVEAILKDKGVAWGVVETDEDEAQIRDTADFVYARLRKIEYTDEELQHWAAFFRTRLEQNKDCYVFCRHKDTKAPWLWADKLIELT